MKNLKRTAIIGLSLLAATAFAAEEPTADQIVQKARAAYAALSSYSDSGTVVTVSCGQTISLEFDIRLQRPNLYRVNWTQKKGLMPGLAADNGMAWSDGNSDFYQTTCSWAGNGPVAKKKMPDMNGTLGGSIGYSMFATATIPGAFFARNLNDHFAYPATDGKFSLTKQQTKLALSRGFAPRTSAFAERRAELFTP